jgi:hypothetical protein
MRHATPARHAPPDAVFTTRALQDFASRIQAADSLEQLLDSILAGIEEIFGFSNSMILLPGEQDGVLVAIASRGYAETGVGAEVRIGEGIAGMVGEARKPIRISGLMRGMLYALAVSAPRAGCAKPAHRCRAGASRASWACAAARARRLVGGIASSEIAYRFHENRPRSSCSAATATRSEHAVSQASGDRARACRGTDPEAAPGWRLPCHNILFWSGRSDHGGRRLPHSGSAGPHFLEAAAAARRAGTHRVHQS